MCLIILAHRHHPDYPLVLSANRDEFFSRPTRAAQFWPAEEGCEMLLGGKDLTLGGTWLGITHSGKFAAVTNVRNPELQNQNPDKSRGLLTCEFLCGSQTLDSYVQQVLESGVQYAGFNLLIGDPTGLVYISNQAAEPIPMGPGIYGLSNGTLDAPWPKVIRGKSSLRDIMGKPSQLKPETLLEIMTNRETAPDSELPRTGVPLPLERKLSSSFILDQERDYGTRCTTGMIIDKAGYVQFCEQNYDNEARPVGRSLFTFELENAWPADIPG